MPCAVRNFSEAKTEFDVRYYLWSSWLFEEEIARGFPNLSSFKEGTPWDTYLFLKDLPRDKQLTCARSLLKRFHPRAVQHLAESYTPEELNLQRRRDEAWLQPKAVDAQLERIQEIKSKGKLATKKELRRATTALGEQAFGKDFVITGNHEDPELIFTTSQSGWVFQTMFDLGRKEPLIHYTQSICSEKTFPYMGVQWPLIIGSIISFTAHLGVASQTEWRLILKNEIEQSCHHAINLCLQFLDVAPKLLKGLDPKSLFPDNLDLPGF